MTGRIDPSDYLLGELTEAERKQAERRLREEPEFRAQVERLQPVVNELRDLPPQAWQLSEHPEEVAPSPPAAGQRGRWPRLRLALAAGVACAVLIGAGLGIGALIFGSDGGGSASAATVVLRPVAPRASRATGTASLDEKDARATVRVSGLSPSAPTSYYELWLMDGPDRLVSLGSFRVPASGDATVTVPLPVDARLFHFLDISVEPVDGGPQHSGVSVLRAPT
jgi:anti-sigma-K factor RskA